MLLVISLIWPVVILQGLPIALYNRLVPAPGNFTNFCALRFPGNHLKFLVIFKYLEFTMYYVTPMVLQITCYVIIGRNLFAGATALHRKRVVVTQDGVQKERASEAMKARQGVIKMLVASVIIYFISYSPHQVLLLYNTLSPAPFHQTWVYLVFVTAMGYINSAANPVLYCIFSQNFRHKFLFVFSCRCCSSADARDIHLRMNFTSHNSGVGEPTTSTRYTRVPIKVL